MNGPNYSKVPLLSWIAPDGTHLPADSPRLTGYHFRPIVESEGTGETVSETVSRMLTCAMCGDAGTCSMCRAEDDTPRGGGGPRVPLAPVPPTTPVGGGGAKPLPKRTPAILRP